MEKKLQRQKMKESKLFEDITGNDQNRFFEFSKSSVRVKNNNCDEKVVYCCLKSKEKQNPNANHLKRFDQSNVINKQVRQEKKRLSKLPTIPSSLSMNKFPTVQKYFSRNDIVKDRLEKGVPLNSPNGKNSQVSRSNPKKTFRISQGQENYCSQTKYKKMTLGKGKTVGFDKENYYEKEAIGKYFGKTERNDDHRSQATYENTDNHKLTKMNRHSTVESVSHSRKSRSDLQKQMMELQIIKKKNEYNFYKLQKKNNYQRMQSNIIITQAMNELMTKREQLLMSSHQSDEDDGQREMQNGEGKNIER